MQDRKFGLIEISPDSVDEWRRWGAVLMGEKRDEATQSLAEEGLTQEHVFLLELDSKHYLGYFLEGEAMPANLERELNKQHQTLLKQSKIRKLSGELLYSLTSEVHK